MQPVEARPNEAAGFVRTADRLFHRAEQIIYIGLGAVLTLTAVIALAGAGRLMWGGMLDWTGTGAVFEVTDRLLFVLMLVEILYTIRASMQSGGLNGEPFLIVALIASIRRILVISLESSNVTQPDHWTPQAAELFNAAMLELGVLAGLIVVLVGAIYFMRRHRLG